MNPRHRTRSRTRAPGSDPAHPATTGPRALAIPASPADPAAATPRAALAAATPHTTATDTAATHAAATHAAATGSAGMGVGVATESTAATAAMTSQATVATGHHRAGRGRRHPDGELGRVRARRRLPVLAVLFALGLSYGLVLVPGRAFAAGAPGLIPLAREASVLAAPAGNGGNQLNTVIGNFVNWAQSMLVYLATATFVVGGLRYLFAFGDMSEIDAGKRTMKAGATGFLIAGLATAFAQILSSIVGVG